MAKATKKAAPKSPKEKPLKLDMTFEEAMKLAATTPPSKKKKAKK
jgi:hypothetical protein